VIVDYGPVAETKAKAFALVGDYRTANPLYRWFVAPFVRSRSDPAQPSYGMRANSPSARVTYGELFRKVVVP
jgi:hypothetical protein